MKISGATKITGIFGWPVRHTLSPAMHNAAFMRLGLDFIYVPFEVMPGELKRAVNSIKALNIAGVNVTVPHKERIVPMMDRLGPMVKQIGSANTIVNSNGILTGYNTDASGFLKDLKSSGFKPEGKTAVLLGAGGAGKAVAAALSASGIKKLFIADFDEAKAVSLARRTPKASYAAMDRWKNTGKDCDLLVNATPIGMRPGKPPVRTKELRKGLFVYDLVYNRRTELSKECSKAGAHYQSGLGMLLQQGVLAFELMTGKKAPVAVMHEALKKQFSAGWAGTKYFPCLPSAKRR